MKNRKKFFIGLVIFLLVKLPAAYAFGARELYIHDVSNPDRYTLEVSYPYLEGSSEQAQAFNKILTHYINHQKAKFLKVLAAREKADVSGVPQAEQNKLLIQNRVELNNDCYISVRFAIETYYARDAHPNLIIEVLNYDFNKQKMMSLASLFSPDTNYLKQIAAYCKNALLDKLQAQISENPLLSKTIEQGTIPIKKNYRYWALKENGLLVIFPQYQIGPRQLGVQEVLIPCNELKGFQIDEQCSNTRV
ncbi:MAG: RsiV family protein [Gammaproteobacteria bacterium]